MSIYNGESSIYGAGLVAPRLSTQEMIPPDVVQRQCNEWKKMIDMQLEVGVHALNTQLNLERNSLRAQAALKIANFNAEIEQEVKEEQHSWSQQQEEQRLSICQDVNERNQELDASATENIFNYRTQELQERILGQQEEMEKKHADTQLKLEEDMKQLAHH